ncbi:MAG: adenylate kinase [Arachidicoccus sp.]|nr:adenylate kinase [Arachidicoccus sp.]
MFNVILFGAPGSGKGTQSQKIVEKYQLKHISTGDLLRSEIAGGTTLGLEAKKFMDDGKLVPDEVVIGMIGNLIDKNKDAKGFLFDGFPRTIAQAEALDELLKKSNAEINVVIALEVSEEELVTRLLGRGKISGRSDDANETVIRSRIEEYRKKTAVVADYYQQFDKVKSVQGEGSVEEIFELLSKIIDAVI